MKKLFNKYILNDFEFNDREHLIDEYLKQIKLKNLEIEKLKEDLKKSENLRRKNAGKAGGLTKFLNKKQKEIEELYIKTKNLDIQIDELKSEIKLKNLELEKKDAQIKILKGIGKQKQINDYEKLREINKDIEKHRRER